MLGAIVYLRDWGALFDFRGRLASDLRGCGSLFRDVRENILVGAQRLFGWWRMIFAGKGAVQRTSNRHWSQRQDTN